MAILFPCFKIFTLSNDLIGDSAAQEEDRKVEKSFVPSKSVAAFFIHSIFKMDFMCQALFFYKDSEAIRLIITYL